MFKPYFYKKNSTNVLPGMHLLARRYVFIQCCTKLHFIMIIIIAGIVTFA